MNASWLSANISADAASVVGYLLAALAALAVVLCCFAFFRRKRSRVSRRPEQRHEHRVSVRDSIALDKRRRLVLVRRDNIEHLLLTGGDSDLVVESFRDLAAGQDHAAEAQRFAARRDNAKSPSSGGEAAAAPGRADNAYMARPQPLPGAEGAAGNDRQDFAAEKALARRVRRDMPPGREAPPYPQPAAGPSYPPQHNAGIKAEAAYRGRPDNSRPDADMWPDERDRPGRPGRDMQGNSALAAHHQAPRRNTMESFPAPHPNMAAGRPNGQNGSYPQAYPAAERPGAQPGQENRAGGDRRDFGDRAEALPQNGAFSPYAGKDDRPAAYNTMPPDGQNTALPAMRGHEAAAAGHAPARAAADNRQNSAPRPIITEAYAPYLGYMPRSVQPPAAANNGQNPAPHSERTAQANGRQSTGGDNAPAFIAGQGERAAHNGALPGNPERGRPADRANADLRPPVMPARQQNFRNRDDRSNGNGFDLAPPNAANGFSKLAPAADNDFDKILQDELLRAPNGIKFPSPPKK